ncbi:RagB/SusD family nutrient uptake outer membrane protein [Thermophagus sp. OGC60D27]|uniref:RagB/SusD family nutrient uptake outer membrane protein n=1 Tax=Thermophagus sp. OGC60D27 TaxID=3458415 RepID=UPI004037911C
MKKIAYILLISMSFLGCVDVEEEVYDKYAAKDFYASPEGSDAALASVYAQIPGNWDGFGYAGADNGWYDLNCMSTDEQVVPHRNTGDWQLEFARIYLRDWQPSNYLLNNTWNWLYQSVFRANTAIEQLEAANADPMKIAEARVLRAFFYYLLIDDFGDVPWFVKNELPVDSIPQTPRAEIFDFIVSELETYMDDLSLTKGGNFYGRINRWAGLAILAKVYLNAEVYVGDPMYEKCLSVCDEIINEGGFSLHSAEEDASHPLKSKYYELFGDVCPNDETIWAIYTTADVVGRNIFTIRSFWGNDGTLLFGYGAWNGTVVPPEFIALYEDHDIRKRQFRYGSDPYGPQPEGFINYLLEIDNLDNPGAAPEAGARNMKFWPVEPMSSGGASNDFPIYRYADILLMKAECLIRLGNAADAKPFVDEVRQRVGLNSLSTNPTLNDVYDERGRELNWEGHRRQDMIRFGTFTRSHGLVPEVDEKYHLFPIPTAALNANPRLKQNPGW